jgi:nicotinic acid mononucleotide adenylyltransferase
LRRALAPSAFARLERGLLRSAPHPQASTDVREALARGSLPDGALPAGVLEYIRSKGIYA